MAISDRIRRAAAALETATAQTETLVRSLYETTDEHQPQRAWVDLFRNEFDRLASATDDLVTAITVEGRNG